MGGPKPGILILEDNYLTADALSDLVRAYGYDVVATVGRVDSAFQFLKDNHVDGAIVDINLHGDTSFRLCHELKRRSVPFFFLSGYEHSILPAAFTEHRLLSKPVDFEHFRTALADFGAVERPSRAPLGNSLLDGLAEPAFRALEPKLERVPLPQGRTLHAARQPIAHVHFPVRGLISLMARDKRGRRLEVGQIGRDGMVGATELLANGGPAVTEAVVQFAGEAWRAPMAELVPLVRLNRTLQTSVMRYVHMLTEEMTQIALATGHGTIDQRVARWLLTAGLRSDSRHLEVTHEHLARVLAVRRSGITVALHVLEGLGTIRSHRRRIEIIDRAALQRASGGLA
jgi:CRP-like cAMP-binding protein/ActR/RegA family two-component response regulator